MISSFILIEQLDMEFLRPYYHSLLLGVELDHDMRTHIGI